MNVESQYCLIVDGVAQLVGGVAAYFNCVIVSLGPD
jgi:hypothetical protein